MKKELFIGLGIVSVIVIGTGLFLASQADQRDDKLTSESTENSNEISQVVWLNSLNDESKYSFCQGIAKINTDYNDPILNNSGKINYSSTEILLLDKEAKKYYILARKSEFNYQGKLKTNLGGVAIDTPVSESGILYETYDKNSKPVRIDFINQIFVSDPETNEKAWVRSTIGEEVEMVTPRSGCSGIYPLVNDETDMINLNYKCSESDVSGNYNGEIKFECNTLNHQQALDIINDYSKEAATKSQKSINDTPNSGAASVKSNDQSNDESKNDFEGVIESRNTEQEKAEMDEAMKKLKELQGTKPASQNQ